MKKTTTHKRLQGAIVGFGNMAEKGHLPGWMKDRRVSIRAVCDPESKRRKRARKLLPDAKTYPTIEELLARENLDFIDICTTPPFHAENMLTGLRRGLHVICEKPFVGSRDEFKKILRLCEKNQRIAFPVHNWKHAPALAKAREWVQKELQGRVLFSEFHTLRTQPAIGLTPWRKDKQDAGGGGILLDHGWHGIYLLLNFHGEYPRTVSAWADPPPGPTGLAEHTVHMLLEFPSSTGSLFLSWLSPKRYNSARIYGNQGLLILEDTRIALHRPKGTPRTATFKGPLSQGSHHPDWFPPVAKDFIDATTRREKARKELEEAYLCLEITLQAYASIRRGGKRMKIPAKFALLDQLK